MRKVRRIGRKALRDCDEKALEDFGRIIALDPKKAENWAARADFYRVTGRMREGIADVRKALELAPDNLGDPEARGPAV